MVKKNYLQITHESQKLNPGINIQLLFKKNEDFQHLKGKKLFNRSYNVVENPTWMKSFRHPGIDFNNDIKL